MRFIPCLMVLALLGGESVAMAQGMSGGVKGGVNFATLSFDPDDELADFGTRTGIVVGGFVTWPIGSNLAIQPEGLYSQKGAQADEAGATAKIKLDYFEVPVLLRYTTDSGGTAFHVFGGPSMAFKLNAKASASFGGETTEEDVGEQIKDFDFGIVVGAGVGFGRLIIEGRYTFGLTDINDDAEEPTKIKNRVISLMAGVRF